MKIIECVECSGGGFSGQGTCYNDVCDNCGGKGELPANDFKVREYEVSVKTDKKQSFSDFFEVESDLNTAMLVIKGLAKIQPMLKANNIGLENIVDCKINIRA